MQDKDTHIIQRQVFELNVSGPGTGFAWEQHAAEYLHRIIQPCIQASFDALPLQGQHLVIDRLEIDLGVFGPGKFEKDAPAKLREMLGKLLQQYAVTPLPDNVDAYTSSPVVQKLSEAQAAHQVLLSFLTLGRFPWWHKMHGRPQYLDELFSISQIQSLHDHGKHKLKETLQASQAARLRLSNHFSAAWISSCLQLLEMKGEEGRRQWDVLSPALASFPSLQPLFHQHFWTMWMESSGSLHLPLLLERTAGGFNTVTVELADIILRTEQCGHMHAALQTYLSAKHTAAETTPAANSTDEMTLKEERKTIPPEIEMKEISAVIAEQSLSKTGMAKKPEGEGQPSIFVEAAGLVILHPFLPELFRMAGLWEKEGWHDPGSPLRALQLLSWLAFGETGLHEYRLVFLKMLAGLDAETPIPAVPPLTDVETSACRELLEAVIRHWSVLRNTSPEGLQEGFLQREGKLSSGEGNDLLQVEPKAQDVLLSHLPWGYGVVKLPWMKQMLHVTWI